MKRTTKNQILAGIALFAIAFSVISTAILVLFSSNTATAPSESDLKELLKNYTGSIQVMTGETLTGTTKK